MKWIHVSPRHPAGATRPASLALLGVAFALGVLSPNARSQGADELERKVQRIAERAEKLDATRLSPLLDELVQIADGGHADQVLDAIDKAKGTAPAKAKLIYGQAILNLAVGPKRIEEGTALLLDVVGPGIDDELGQRAAQAMRSGAVLSSEAACQRAADALADHLDRGHLPALTRLQSAITMFAIGSSAQQAQAKREIMTMLRSADPMLSQQAVLAMAEIGDVDSVRKQLEDLSRHPSELGQLAELYLRLDSTIRLYQAKLVRQREEARRSGEGARRGEVLKRDDLALLDQIAGDIQRLHIWGDEYTREDLVRAAARGMLGSLDPHSSFISGEEYKEFIFDLNQDYGGIGAFVNTVNGVFTIIRPIYSGPAYEAGLLSGDAILEVDGWSTAGEPNDEIIKRLKGVPGTSLKVKIFRRGFTEPREFDIRREHINVPSIQYELLPGGIGYVELISFTRNAGREVHDAVRDLKSRGMTGLVFDLRNNSGGYLDQAVDVANVFLPRETKVVITKSKIGPDGPMYTRRRADADPEMPVVVLINRRSASASEIVAGALQVESRATLVGERSYGKGTVQQLIPLGEDEDYDDKNLNGRFDEYETFRDTNPNGKDGVYDYAPRMKLTIAEYFLPNGKSINTRYKKDGTVIERGGIEPNFEADNPPLELWKLQELDALIEKEVFRTYVKEHFETNRDLFIKLAESDGLDPSRYPDFEEFFQSLDVKTIDRDEVRKWLRLRLREAVSDARGKVFPGYRFLGDFEEDVPLQRAIQLLLERKGQKLSSVPEFEKVEERLTAALEANAEKKNG